MQIDQQCTLEGVNGDRPRNDEGEPWCCLRFSFDNLAADEVAKVLGCKGGGKAVRAAFFDEDGRNRFPGADNIPIGRRFENTHSVKISGGARLKVDSLWGIQLTPYGKNVFSGSFKLTITELPEGFVDAMLDKCHRLVKVQLTQEQKELFDVEQEDEAKAAKAPKQTEAAV